MSHNCHVQYRFSGDAQRVYVCLRREVLPILQLRAWPDPRAVQLRVRRRAARPEARVRELARLRYASARGARGVRPPCIRTVFLPGWHYPV